MTDKYMTKEYIENMPDAYSNKEEIRILREEIIEITKQLKKLNRGR